MANPIEEVAPNLFRIAVPLPLSGVAFVNAYVIEDSGRNLLIDPGMAHDLCYGTLISSLNEIGINLENTDFFLTHHHLDHFGLVPQLISDKATVYINQTETQAIQDIASGRTLADLTQLLEDIGFPEKNPQMVVPEMFGAEYRFGARLPFRSIAEGEKLKWGEYCFECLVMPGHSIAHTCLYEPNRKILIAGDAISPVLQFVSIQANPLYHHLRSLERFRRMKIDLVLPGHRPPINDCYNHIDTLRSYHLKKLKRVQQAIQGKKRTASQGAASLWSSAEGNGNWETLSLSRRFFLTRDFFAYMCYLEQKTDR